MGPKTTKLLATLDELGEQLSDAGHDHWARWVAESARRLRSSDASGLEHLLGAYGGMGSLNDLVLPEASRQLRSLAYDQVQAIKEDLVIDQNGEPSDRVGNSSGDN